MKADPTEGGTATDLTDESPYTEGTEVSIKAEANEGWEFDGWTSDEVAFDDASDPETTFIMPAEHVTVTANFVPEKTKCFEETFADSDLPGWDTRDTTWNSEYEGKEGVIFISWEKADMFAPRTVRYLTPEEACDEDIYTWHFQVYIPSFTFVGWGEPNAMYLGRIFIDVEDTDELLAVVVDKDGHLGIQYGDLFDDPPVYSDTPVVSTGEWSDIYVKLNGVDNEVVLYHGTVEVLSLSWNKKIEPVGEIWLGSPTMTSWVMPEHYGRPHDGVYFAEVSLFPGSP